MPEHRGERADDGRAGATAAAIVFIGLLIATALLAGGFYVHVTSGEDIGDPTKIDIAASTCTVSTDGDTAGIGSATLSVRYRGNGTIDLSDAALRYTIEKTTATLDLDAETSSNSARIRNGSGAHDATIAAGELRAVVVPVAAVQGAPLQANERATFELVLDGSTIASTSIRTPGAVGPEQSFVNC